MNISNVTVKSTIRAHISWTHDMAVTHVCALHILAHVLSSQPSSKGILSLFLFHGWEN